MIWRQTLRWRRNGCDCVSNHQRHHCLPNRLFRRRSKKTSKLRVTGLCVGNSPGTGEFPALMASDAENVSIWWRHHNQPQNRGYLQSSKHRSHRSPVNSPHKGQWRGALEFSLICAWIHGWVNNRQAGDLRRHHAPYDVIAMYLRNMYYRGLGGGGGRCHTNCFINIYVEIGSQPLNIYN